MSGGGSSNAGLSSGLSVICHWKGLGSDRWGGAVAAAAGVFEAQGGVPLMAFKLVSKHVTHLARKSYLIATGDFAGIADLEFITLECNGFDEAYGVIPDRTLLELGLAFSVVKLCNDRPCKLFALSLENELVFMKSAWAFELGVP